MCVNEKGWGLVVGECSEGNEREGWHSLGLIQGPLRCCGEPQTMHGCAIVTETPHSTTAMERGEAGMRGEKEIEKGREGGST